MNACNLKTGIYNMLNCLSTPFQDAANSESTGVMHSWLLECYIRVNIKANAQCRKTPFTSVYLLILVLHMHRHNGKRLIVVGQVAKRNKENQSSDSTDRERTITAKGSD